MSKNKNVSKKIRNGTLVTFKESLDKRFATVRAGRANPSSLDGISVDYYGSMTPLKQLATISVPEARQLLIKPFDKGALKDIEKAILSSDNPVKIRVGTTIPSSSTLLIK